MDILKLLLLIIVSISSCYMFYTLLAKPKKNPHQKQMPPKVKGALPLIGHLYLLRGNKQPQKVFGEMADEYGPIFTVQFGSSKSVVVSSWEMARECLYVNDRATCDRIKAVAVEIMCYNYAMFGFGPYGPYWRHMRKLVKLELLSNHRMNLLSRVWEAEVKSFTQKMYKQWATKKNPSNKILVDMQSYFGDVVLNIMVSIVFGKHSIMDDATRSRFKEEVKELVDHMGSFTVGDALPFLRFLDIGGQEKAMKRVADTLDRTVQGWLDEHKRRMSTNLEEEELDFMDVMLRRIDDEATKYCDHDSDTIIKATCVSMLLGGSDESQSALTWALSLLMNNPDAMRKAKEEMTTKVGKDRLVELSDIPSLVYLQSIIKETLRLYPPQPLMGPRSFVEDAIVGDYHVPANTRLIVNLHKMFSDPRVWEEPLQFKPERFLEKTSYNFPEIIAGTHLEFIPFGSGRRICPGAAFGVQLVHLCLASFIHAFDFESLFDEPVDMSEGFGFTNHKLEPLEVLVSPALSSHVYV